jgi:hypothetical protein
MISLPSNKIISYTTAIICLVSSIAYGFCVKIENPEDNDTVSDTVNIIAGFSSNNCDKNKSYKEISDLIDSVQTDIDKDLLRAIAWQEGGKDWIQFDENGHVSTNKNVDSNGKITYDYGLMQINNKKSSLDGSWDFDKINSDINYNITAGIQAFKNKTSEIDGLMQRHPNIGKDIQSGNHTLQDYLLRLYNGFDAEDKWGYANAVNGWLKDKPWQEKVQVALSIDAKAVDNKQVSLNESYNYPWNTDPESEGQHTIATRAVKTRTNEQSQDSIVVEKKNESKWKGSIKGIVITEKYVNGKYLPVEHPFSLQINTLDDIDVNKLKAGAISKDEFIASAKDAMAKMQQAQTDAKTITPEMEMMLKNNAVVSRTIVGKCDLILDIPDEGTHINEQTSFLINICDSLSLMISHTQSDVGNSNGLATQLLLHTDAYLLNVVDDDTITINLSWVEYMKKRENSNNSLNNITNVSGTLTRVKKRQ